MLKWVFLLIFTFTIGDPDIDIGIHLESGLREKDHELIKEIKDPEEISTGMRKKRSVIT